MAGPDFGYDVAGLDAAAAGQDASAEQAGKLAESLTRIVIAPTDLGAVPSVARFVTAAQAARNAEAAGAHAESARRAGLGVRARTNAHMGAQLTQDSTAIATSAAPVPPAVEFGDGVGILQPPG